MAVVWLLYLKASSAESIIDITREHQGELVLLFHNNRLLDPRNSYQTRFYRELVDHFVSDPVALRLVPSSF